MYVFTLPLWLQFLLKVAMMKHQRLPKRPNTNILVEAIWKQFNEINQKPSVKSPKEE